MAAQRCTACNVERRLVYAEPAASGYELRFYRCSRCKSTLRAVEQHEPLRSPARRLRTRGSQRLDSMTSILDFIDEQDLGSVDSFERKLIDRAFHVACNDLRDARQPTQMYADVARRIVEIVRSGERDPEKVSDRALTALGRNRSAE
jgi:hypothetical protein